MQHLFLAWDSFASEIRVASHTILLSDYDGTLTPIVSRPEEAILSPEVREKLRALAERPTFSVGIISGRSLSEVQSMVGLEGIYYAGNHGLEIEGPGPQSVNMEAKAAQAELKELAAQLTARLSGIEGVIIEDKGLTLSVHYRLVREEEEKVVADILHQVTSPGLSEGKIKITSGKKVWEVRPPIDWHKGKAVEAVVQEIKALHRGEEGPTIYLGDDTTDEDAFKVIHRPQGWSIFIGQETTPSNAEYFLSSTLEVETFLSRLHDFK